MEALLGTHLQGKDGQVATADAFAGKKAVALYFSAHWCPPCRGFTPKLAEWYQKDLAGKGLEVVFVSSDRDQAAFDEYFGEQPWLALPYDQRDAKNSLSKAFKVQGIPSLVVVDPATGETITTDGRAAVSKDPTGEKLPWHPPTKAEIAEQTLAALAGGLVDKQGASHSREDRLTKGKQIGLYFSAHWCPPCRNFTPKLAEAYSNGLSDKMEIVFVSSDRDDAAFNEYLGEMPWVALPFADREAKQNLSELYGVQGIPTLVVLDSEGKLVTDQGTSMLSKDPTGQNLPDGWRPQPLADVNDDPSPLNSETCVIALGGDQAVQDAMAEVAKEHHQAAGMEVDKMSFRFFTATEGNVESQIRKLTELDGVKEPTLLVLDIPDDGGFYVCGGAITADSVRTAIDQYKAKELERKQLKN